MFKKVLEFTMTPSGIDTAKLYPILMSSGLPREALGQIWASANRTTPGMLTKEELYTVLALIGVAQVNAWVKAKSPLGNLMDNLQWWPHSLVMNAIRGRGNGEPRKHFFLKHCKLSIFLYSNLVWQGLLIFLAWVCRQNPQENRNPQAAHETLHATAYMRGIIRHLWQCKSSGVLKSYMEERF